MGDISLRLVVIVIGNKILHRIVGEKFPELRAKLGRQGLIVGQNQSGPVHLLNNRCHREGLTGTGHTQQGLLP